MTASASAASLVANSEELSTMGSTLMGVLVAGSEKTGVAGNSSCTVGMRVGKTVESLVQAVHTIKKGKMRRINLILMVLIMIGKERSCQ
jgi:anti-anti-sigma regulatory factor